MTKVTLDVTVKSNIPAFWRMLPHTWFRTLYERMERAKEYVVTNFPVRIHNVELTYREVDGEAIFELKARDKEVKIRVYEFGRKAYTIPIAAFKKKVEHGEVRKPLELMSQKERELWLRERVLIRRNVKMPAIPASKIITSECERLSAHVKKQLPVEINKLIRSLAIYE